MNYEAIEVYARAAREIEALKQTGEMKSSAGYLVGKLRKAIEMEAGIEAHENTSAWLRSAIAPLSGEASDHGTLVVCLTEFADTARKLWPAARIAFPGAMLTGLSFDKIIVALRPDPGQAGKGHYRAFIDEMSLRLKAGGSLIELFSQ